MSINQLSNQLFNNVYPELKRIASAQLSRERANHTLCPTELVNETYLKLEKNSAFSFNNKQHFIALCGRNIRQVLVDHARKKKRVKRGSGQQAITLKNHMGQVEANVEHDVLELNELLNNLESIDPIQASIVELRFFSGLTVEEVADELDISVSSVKRKWTLGRAWLYREMKS
ncbi:MAG: sigma-70 family RNA polymerase sigma factor [Thiotrichaceae bacterium]|nr:sigma-70 family RNA polymerase sigma factor [Thiotrichaceae bacterium]